MNAVKVFKEKINEAKNICISLNGDITFTVDELTEEEIEVLSHLRMNAMNGALFDDREYPMKADL